MHSQVLTSSAAPWDTTSLRVAVAEGTASTCRTMLTDLVPGQQRPE
ncbi:MAG: hypothetical protein MZV63_58005 [Marinilabiliales bacterium]|nr:hypothetical protein [Marinilabiliales bacterium]